jgi:cyclopropane fatty-acyl-phospholipid synthase-like methyltransferase
LKEEKTISYWSDMYSRPNVFGSGPTKLAKMANDLIHDKSIKNILEIGCGQGRDSIFFAEKGYFVETFDISENGIKFVNKTKESFNLKNLNAIVHDVTEPFSYPNILFDFVYSNLALQFFNIDRLEKIFNNIYAVMKEESTILFSTKKKGDKYYDFGTKISEDAYEHKGITRYFYDKSILEPMLEQHFEILRFDDDRHTNPNSTISEWWKILLKKK